MSTSEEYSELIVTPKKESISDVDKKLSLSSRGHCARFRCFEVFTEAERAEVLHEFNKLQSHIEQNMYLGGLITKIPIKQRRPRQTEEVAKLWDPSVS